MDPKIDKNVKYFLILTPRSSHVIELFIPGDLDDGKCTDLRHVYRCFHFRAATIGNQVTKRRQRRSRYRNVGVRYLRL